MKILAIDFSSPVRSVALAECADQEFRLLGRTEERHGQSTHAFAMIEKLLVDCGVDRKSIDCLAIGLGPGSYAGIRVSLAIAQGWQLATDLKTIGVSSVDCLAETARAGGRWGSIAFAIDAQRGEFHLAEYELTDADCRETRSLSIVSRDVVEALVAEGKVVCGPDMAVAINQAVDLYTDAARLAEIACRASHFVPADQLTPIYLRAANFVKAPEPLRVY